MKDRSLAAMAQDYCEELREVLAGGTSEPEPSEAGDEPVPAQLQAMFDRLAASRPPRPEPAAGQAWTVQPGAARGVGALVVLTEVEGDRLRGVVLTPEAWLADDRDLVLGGDGCPGGEALAALLALEVALRPGELVEPAGELGGEALTALRLALAARAGTDHVRTPAGSVPRSALSGAELAAPTLLRWTIRAPNGRSAIVHSGVPLDGDDPRQEARALLEEALAWLPRPAPAPLSEQAREVAAAAVRRLAERLDRALAGEQDRGFSMARLVSSFVIGAVAAGAARGRDDGAANIRLGDVDVALAVASDDRRVVVAIRARARGTETPVAGVTLSVEGSAAQQTGADGTTPGLELPLSGPVTLVLRRGREERRIEL